MQLSDSTGFSRYADKLEKLGFAGPDGLDKLLGAARAAPGPLAAYLEISPIDIAQLVNDQIRQQPVMSNQEMQQLAALPCPVGAAIDIPPLALSGGRRAAIVATPVSSPATVAALPAAVDLRPSMPPVRDQGQRGTCVAFAALAAFEHRLPGGTDLSEQFLYWNCKMNDGRPTEEGTWVVTAMTLLAQDGVCDETTWRYVSNKLIPPNESQDPPPAGAIVAAVARRVPTLQIGKNVVAEYKRALHAARCIAISIPVFDSWYLNPYVRKTGELALPLPGEMATSGHAVCVVGYADDPSPQYPGGGYFILRNSWGTGWAPGSAIAPGYGTIPYAYISRWGNEAWIIR